MRLSVQIHLSYSTTQPCDLLLQIEPTTDATQICRETRLMIGSQPPQQEIANEDGIGLRRWIHAGPQFVCDFETTVEVNRVAAKIETLQDTPRLQIPGDVVKYLMPSRYCHSDLFLDFVQSQFGALTGGAKIAAMRDWISDNFTYDNTISNAATTASDSFASQAGVCRDYAHVLISFSRAAGIPAQFVSAYAPDVTPQDFHAVVEVYLQGDWHLIDATGMAKPEEIVRICVGRDAADASFLTSYGGVELQEQTVQVARKMS